MRLLAVLLLSLFLVSFSWNLAAQDEIGVRRTGTGTLRGRVVSAQTGLPIRDVSVMAVTAGTPQTQRGALTDAGGRFEIAGLPAGRYDVTASKAGHLTISYGPRRAGEAPRSLELADNQVLDKIDFSLPRGGVVAGRILDEVGEPLPDAMVQVTPLRAGDGPQRAVAGGERSQTDDLGQFRIYDLPPGDYHVSAAPSSPPSMVAGTPGHAGMPVDARTYYPGVPLVTDALPVTVGVSQEVSGLAVFGAWRPYSKTHRRGHRGAHPRRVW